MHTTPWGIPDHIIDLGDGVKIVHTPSHGGIYVPPEIARAGIPAAYFEEGSFASQRRAGWFEEDCDAAIVIVHMPERFRSHYGDRWDDVYKACAESLMRWHQTATVSSLGETT